jgi:hypothetical protein
MVFRACLAASVVSFSAALLDHLAVAHRLVRDGQLEQPVEQHPTTPGRSSVETEHELVEVTLEVVALRTQGNPRPQPTAHASGGPTSTHDV